MARNCLLFKQPMGNQIECMTMLGHELRAAFLAFAQHSFNLVINEAIGVFRELSLLAKILAKKHGCRSTPSARPDSIAHAKLGHHAPSSLGRNLQIVTGSRGAMIEDEFLCDAAAHGDHN